VLPGHQRTGPSEEEEEDEDEEEEEEEEFHMFMEKTGGRKFKNSRR
jgi:hypothetical protein